MASSSSLTITPLPSSSSSTSPTTPSEEQQHHNQLQLDMEHTLEWHVESFTVQIRGRTGRRSNKDGRPNTKTILRNLAGRTTSGELTAIMGCSGSGKTTLLECISLRNRQFEGAVHYDGQAPTGRFFTTSAFVHQQEMLYPYLTAREHLTFHAIARMSGRKDGFTRADMLQRVEDVLKEVKLIKCSDTLVGGTDPVFMVKGLSGGERKRLSIATELLLTPQLIFMDEPSSGLDSVMSESIFQTLKDLTVQGRRIVMASVHCPSSKTYHLFSTLILLTCDGRLAYNGPASTALAYFQGTLGLKCPAMYNPGDLVLELVSASPEVDVNEELRRMNEIHEAYIQSSMFISQPLPPDSEHKVYHNVHGLSASSWTLFKLNLGRSNLQLKRDLITVGLYGVVSVIIGFLFGILYFQQAADNWRNLMGLIFSVVVAQIFTGAIGTILRFPLEWSLICREYFAGANRMAPYLASRFIMTTPLSYGPFLLATIVYWMTGMDPDVKTFVYFSLIFISYNWSCLSMGQWVSTFSANPLISLTLL